MILPSDYFAKQQVNAIRFYEAASAAVKDGFDVFVVLGKDKDIAAALKKIAGDDNVFIADSVADLKKISEKVKLEPEEAAPAEEQPAPAEEAAAEEPAKE